MEQKVREALGRVFDPCSINANAPLSVIDMGLITKIDIGAGSAVRIGLRPTSPWCTMIGSIMKGVEDQVAAIPGIASVCVEIDRESPWSEAELSAQGREKLLAVRAQSRALRPVRPQQWREGMPAIVTIGKQG